MARQQQYTFQPQLQNPEWMIVYSIHRCSPFDRNNVLTENFYRTLNMYATTDRYTAMLTTILRALYGDYPEYTTCKVFLMRKRDFDELKIEKRNENRWNHQLLYRSDKPIQQTILYTLTINPQGKIDLTTPFSNHPKIKAMQRSFHFRELRELILFSYKDAEADIFKHINPSQKRTKLIVQKQGEKNYQAFNDVFLAAVSDFYPLEETDKLTEEDFKSIITLLSALTLLLAIVCKEPARLARPAILRGVEPLAHSTFLHPHDPIMALFETTSVSTLFERGGFLRYWISFLNELDPRFLPSENESPYEVRRRNMDVLIEEIQRAYAYLDEANGLKFAQTLVQDLMLMKLPTDNFLKNLVENPVIPKPEEVLTEPSPEVKLELLKPLIIIDPDLLLEGPLRLNIGQPFNPSDLVTQTICVDDSHKYFQFLPEGMKIFNLLSRISNQFDFILLGGNLSERSVQLNEVRKNYMSFNNKALAPFPTFKLALTTVGEEIANHSQSNRIIHSPDAQPLIENFYVIDPFQGGTTSEELAEAQRNDLPEQIYNILVNRFAFIYSYFISTPTSGVIT